MVKDCHIGTSWAQLQISTFDPMPFLCITVLSLKSLKVLVCCIYVLLWFFHTDDGRLNQALITMGLFLGLLVIIIIIIGSVLYKKTKRSPQGKI